MVGHLTHRKSTPTLPMKLRFLLLALLPCLPAPLFAQNTTAENPGNVWSCELPGGKFGVALESITSVSQHEYVLDVAARISEVVIATNGSLIARFYFVENMRPTTPSGIGQSTVNAVVEKMEQAADRTGVEPVWRKVVKSYPTSTHAHTVEYRLESREQLDKLFDHADRAWRNKRPGTFRQK